MYSLLIGDWSKPTSHFLLASTNSLLFSIIKHSNFCLYIPFAFAYIFAYYIYNIHFCIYLFSLFLSFYFTNAFCDYKRRKFYHNVILYWPQIFSFMYFFIYLISLSFLTGLKSNPKWRGKIIIKKIHSILF